MLDCSTSLGDTRQLPLTGGGAPVGEGVKVAACSFPQGIGLKLRILVAGNHRARCYVSRLSHIGAVARRALSPSRFCHDTLHFRLLPGTGSSLNVTWTVCCPGCRGPKETPNLAPPRASTWVGTLSLVGEETRISRLPSPASPASTVRNQVLG